jgi:hypothetical protein
MINSLTVVSIDSAQLINLSGFHSVRYLCVLARWSGLVV